MSKVGKKRIKKRWGSMKKIILGIIIGIAAVIVGIYAYLLFTA